MNRRRVLALLGSAATGGCLGGTESETTTTERTTQTTEETTATPELGTTTETATPSAPELGQPSPSGCPDYNSPRIVCSPETDASMRMDPSSESVSPPSDSLSFTLENTTDVTFESNFHSWRLHKRVEGEWYHVAPEMWPVPLHRLPPGESHAWEVTLDGSPPTCEATCSSADSDVSVRGLGGGTYAFGITGRFAEQEYDGSTGFSARFALDGDPVSLSRADSIESVEREGDLVVVRLPDRDSSRTVTVTRVEDAPEEAERLISEQVVRRPALRNALASFEEDVESVRVENVPRGGSRVFYVDDRSYVAYEEETYRVAEKDETTTG